ncbi:hypothetical protein [Rheinheimera hassiensis]|uniref:hypothetical protein n=1 Tax=Rheinheimera hassiensis TaxID=1193627 RepID=UPI001F05CA9D|nr:hypothetical protein [Rheinheimera hassiensis]
MKVNKIWFFYYCSKVFYMFFAVFIFSRLTILGDTDRYLAGPTFGELSFIYNSTAMMDFFAHGLSRVASQFGAHLFFLSLSVYGVYLPLSKMNLTKNQLITVLIFLSFPSFGVWTSIVSKESVTVFFMGVILAAFIDHFEKRKVTKKLLLLVSIYLCLLFKPQYFIGISSLFVYLFLIGFFNLKAFGKVFVFLLFVFCSLMLLYILRDYIDMLSLIMPEHFESDGGSTRENTIWVNKYDVFFNAPYGILVAFFGPTLGEALSKPQFFLTFMESLVICLAFLYLSLKAMLLSVRRQSFNVHLFSIFFIVTIWLLFVHYPFGVLNPGSAVRYREGFYAFIVCLFYYTYLRLNFTPSSVRGY